MSEIELVLDARADLGEGPIWDDRRQRLLFVDITRGDVHVFDPITRQDEIVHVGAPVGAVALTTRGDWLLAARRGFARADPETGAVTLVADAEPDRSDTRMNDGAVDPAGRFWAGTMSLTGAAGQGALYRFDPNGSVHRMIAPVTTSNGIGWSPDGALMYYVDTRTRRIDVFDFEPISGTPSRRRPFVDLAGESGRPDGLIVDEAGGVWVALWQGGAVHRYTPAGRLDHVIRVPASLTTKCAFGGPALADLYVTTASAGLDARQREEQPHAGGVFRVMPGVAGQPPGRFTG